MFRKLNLELIKYTRNYTSNTKRSLLLQDIEKMQTYEYPTSAPDKLRTYAWGLSETGALGVQTSLQKHAEKYTAIVHHPRRLQFAENCDVFDIAAGYGFSVFAVDRSDGETLFGTGLNTDSQLGLQEKQSGQHLDMLIYPTAIKLPRKTNETNDDMRVKCMSAGRAHLIVVTKNGAIFSLGNNAYGQCGRPIIEQELYKGTNVVHRIENLVDENDEIVGVECGQDHTIFRCKSGRLLSCGWGADGQTGLGHYNTTGTISEISGDVKNEKIIKVTSSCDCVLALNESGDVFGWGNSEYGQITDSDNVPTQLNTPRALNLTKGFGKIIDIAAGGSFCMILNEEGEVFTWGYGILGLGPNVESSKVPKQLFPALFGRNDFSTDCKVISLCSGIFHMGAINSDGDLFMWGKNRFACLGLGHKKDQYFPFKTSVNGKIVKVSCGVDHTLALCKPFI